jgi:hypothetical protein
MTLFVGQRVTLLKIDECLAMTHRYEFDVRKALESEAVGYEKRLTRLAVVRQRGKRKEFFLDLASDDILLDGWNLPFAPTPNATAFGREMLVTTSSATPKPSARGSRRKPSSRSPIQPKPR